MTPPQLEAQPPAKLLKPQMQARAHQVYPRSRVSSCMSLPQPHTCRDPIELYQHCCFANTIITNQGLTRPQEPRRTCQQDEHLVAPPLHADHQAGRHTVRQVHAPARKHSHAGPAPRGLRVPGCCHGCVPPRSVADEQQAAGGLAEHKGVRGTCQAQLQPALAGTRCRGGGR